MTVVQPIERKFNWLIFKTFIQNIVVFSYVHNICSVDFCLLFYFFVIFRSSLITFPQLFKVSLIWTRYNDCQTELKTFNCPEKCSGKSFGSKPYGSIWFHFNERKKNRKEQVQSRHLICSLLLESWYYIEIKWNKNLIENYVSICIYELSWWNSIVHLKNHWYITVSAKFCVSCIAYMCYALAYKSLVSLSYIQLKLPVASHKMN